MNKVMRFKGNTNKVAKDAGNFYIDGDKAVFIDQRKQQFVFTNQNTTNNIENNSMLIENKLKMLEEQILALKTKNAVNVQTNQNVNQPTNDIVISTSQPIIEKTNIVAKSILIKQQNIENTAVSYNADEDINISNLQTAGDLATTVSNAQVSINNEGYVQITNCTIGSNGYNGIEIGLQKTVKSVLIDNVNFTSDLKNNAISIFDTANNATVTISNCNFEKCSNPLRISNRSGNKVTINFVNCNFVQWQKGQYAGCVLCQDYTSKTKEEATENNLFSADKVSINFINCYHEGKKIAFESVEQIAGTKDANQLVYVYVDKQGFVEFGDRYPSVTAQ